MAHQDLALAVCIQNAIVRRPERKRFIAAMHQSGGRDQRYTPPGKRTTRHGGRGVEVDGAGEPFRLWHMNTDRVEY